MRLRLSGPQRGTRNPQRTRQRILQAAFKEFAAKGFAGARVDNIARRASINKRMLYHYFGDKEALFREVLRRKIEQRQAIAAAGQLLEHIRQDGFPHRCRQTGRVARRQQ